MSPSNDPLSVPGPIPRRRLQLGHAMGPHVPSHLRHHSLRVHIPDPGRARGEPGHVEHGPGSGLHHLQDDQHKDEGGLKKTLLVGSCLFLSLLNLLKIIDFGFLLIVKI